MGPYFFGISNQSLPLCEAHGVGRRLPEHLLIYQFAQNVSHRDVHLLDARGLLMRNHDGQISVFHRRAPIASGKHNGAGALGPRSRLRGPVTAAARERLEYGELLRGARVPASPLLILARKAAGKAACAAFRTWAACLRRPALYSYRIMGGGYLETVIVPVNLEVLERLSRAERVTGRLGPWINFGLSEDFAGGFAAFLNAVRQEMSAEQARASVKIAEQF